MNIYKINLNLLKVFLVLMQERQVGLAAKRLHLTQPAISNSLNQLRELFADELFVRGQKQMTPTQKALNLLPQLEQALRQIETVVFQKQHFEYQTEKRIFVIGMSDYAEFVILPKLYAYLKANAPNISLKITTFNHSDYFPPEAFERGELELGIGLAKKISAALKAEHLFDDGTLCAARPDNPIFKQAITLERYLAAEHIAICVPQQSFSRIDGPLKKMRLQRKVKLTLPDVLPAFQTIATSDLIGTFSRNMVLTSAKTYNLKYFEPPFKVNDLRVMQIWHRCQENDVGLIWLRGVIKKICEQHFNRS